MRGKRQEGWSANDALGVMVHKHSGLSDYSLFVNLDLRPALKLHMIR